jgi:flagellar hook-associated protein 2
VRVTGLATGLDVDQIVKDSMKPYRIKIDKKGQDKEILEIRQKLYREVIKDSREFYNKYFDVTNKDSLLLTKNWTTTKLQSSNENVLTATGGSDVKPENYTITGTTATAARTVLTTGMDKDDKILINGKEFTLKGDTEKDRAINLNKELKEAGINVSVRYSDFAGTEAANQKGFIFESTVLGKDSTFTIGGSFTQIGSEVKGLNATAATVTGFTVQNLKDALGEMTIGGEKINIGIKAEHTNEDIEKLLNSKLSDKNLSAKIDVSGNVTFSSKVLGEKAENPNIVIGGNSGIFTKGTEATFTTNTLNINDIYGKKISINGNIIDLSKAAPGKEIDYLNEVLKKQNLSISAKLDGSNVVLTSTRGGADYKVEIDLLDAASGNLVESSAGTDAEITFKDSKGGVYTHKGNSNTVTLDGVTFKITGEIPTEGITVNGKKDVTTVKDKLVNFINDYNKLIEKLNTLTTEKRNKSFMPLTEEQKKGMSESEIKLWNEKVQKGQLSRDQDLTRIANSMKQSMRNLVSGVGVNLEKIGIKPVADYSGVLNGTFTIDENKLSEALEQNPEEVMNLFIKAKPTEEGLSESKKYAEAGIMQRLKEVLYNETVTVSSSIIKKAGVEGSSIAYTNEITKSIKKYEQKMQDMEKDFSRREQALYTKYSKLETIMNKYNSQQGYLAQQLGMK